MDASGGGDVTSEQFLTKLLSSEEYESVKEELRIKIENAVQEEISACLVHKALCETLKTNHASEISCLRLELEAKAADTEEFRKKWQEAATEIGLLQERVASAEEEAGRARESCKKMEYEWKDFKTQRDLACDEKDALLSMIERRTSEINDLKLEKAELTRKMEAAVKAKMLAMEGTEEIESRRINLEYKEKRMEQEWNILKSRVETLSEELEEKTTELWNVRRSQLSKAAASETELASKAEELKTAHEAVADLQDANDRLNRKVEELLERLASQRETSDLMVDNFQQELTAQTKLAALYKGMCSDNDNRTEQLVTSIQELKKLLTIATDKYGDLETKQKEMTLRHQAEIAKRDDCIQLLKRELQDANELLEAAKQENMDAAVSQLSPCAAAASRLIKSGMTLTQIYTQYATVSEQLLLEKEENRRLNLYVTTIVNEIEEKAPLLQQQRLDYERAVAAVESLTKQMDEMLVDTKVLNQEAADAKKTSAHLTRENERLKKELADLGRQVCYLVKAVEEARGGQVAQDTAYESPRGSSAQHVISKHLVTFASIEDLQENNQKLLSLVRQLSEKQEAVETVSSSDYHHLKTQKEKLDQRLTELVEEMDRQSKMLDLIRSQSAMYKKLYHQAMGGSAESPERDVTPEKRSPGPASSTPSSSEAAKLAETKKKLEDANETIRKLENDLNSMKAEMKDKEKTASEKLEQVNSQLREYILSNSKLVAQAEYNQERANVLESNVKTFKKQIAALEERNRVVSEICAKHEQSIVMLKDQAMEAQGKLARSEVQRENLEQDNFLLKTAEVRLTKEREALNRERVTHSLLMTNLDGLKAALERSEAEGKFRLEVQLGDALKECSALRNSLKEEKDRFKELATTLERQANTARERMQEEKSAADKARQELSAVQAELETSNKTIADLHLRIRELSNEPARSVIQAVSGNVDLSSKRVKDMEKRVRELEGECSKLQIQLQSSQANSKQYSEVAESAETQLRRLTELHHNCSLAIADKEKQLRVLETQLSAARDEAEEVRKENERAKQSTASSVEHFSTELTSVETNLQTVGAELEKTRAEVQALTNEVALAKEETTNAKKLVEDAEGRYSQEVVAHSRAIQALDAKQAELETLASQVSGLRQERDEALQALEAKTAVWEEQERRANEEVTLLNRRLNDLDQQNSSLHDSLQKLNDQVAILQAKLSGHSEPGDLDSSLNSSSDLGNKAQEQLVKVIKFLRQEKDIATTKCEVLQAEGTRLKAQVSLLQKQLDESTAVYKTLKESVDVPEKTSAKHAELMRKVESLNAVTDSNRLLREELNRYKAENKSLSERLAKAETGVAPHRKQIDELNEKVEALSTDNQGLLQDAARWKAKALQLSERAKTTPEDWRRLNNERDNLLKQSHAEKAIREKLEENMKKLRFENAALIEQAADVRQKLQQETAEVRRLSEECNTVKQKITLTEQEVSALRSQVKKLSEGASKATEELTANQATIADLRNKDGQIRKIAKKYKSQYEELVKTTEEEKKKRAEEDARRDEEAKKPVPVPEEEQERLRAEGRAQVTEQLTQLESSTTERMRALEAEVASAREQADSLRKEIETSNDKEERAKQVIKTARTKIAQLTEQKQTLEQELNLSRGDAQQNRDESDSRLNNLKASYDAMVARLEKERAEHAELLTQERNQVKSLNQRVNQLQRSLDKQKPSTSSQPVQKSTMDPPTANIKPMAGSSTARKQKQPSSQQSVAVGPYWSAGNETPFASIRPQTRTAAVLPTYQAGEGSSGPPGPLMVPPQQVHTTGTSGEGLSSSPTSSHTDYMPATSSAIPIRVVVAPVPLSVQSTQEGEEAGEGEGSTGPPQQAVAMVQPLETAGSPAPGPSSTPSQASSSSTVTTTQASLKRLRDVEGDAADSEHPNTSPQNKRTRVSASGQSEVLFSVVTHSEVGEIEYQVPTSSQRDQEDDMVIMLDSEDDGNADEGDVEEPDDEQGFEEEENGESYEVESYSRDAQEIGNFDEGPDIDEENGADGGSNEVEIIEDSNEVPNQSQHSHGAASQSVGPPGQEQQQQSSEATSSGNDASSDHVVVSHAASSQSFRTRSVPPLSRGLQGYEEGGDDSIVPSTPTLFLPREAVSSPQVPHQRFTFSEPSPGTSRRDDSGCVEEAGTGRSVPTTPLQVSPQENILDGVIELTVPVSVPHIALSVPEQHVPPTDPSGVSDEETRGQEEILDEPETVTIEEDGDGVTSEGEKPPTVGGEPMEEGREAEASEPIGTIVTTRRQGRQQFPRRGVVRRPTPIVWNEPGSSGLPTAAQMRASPGRGASTTQRGRPLRAQRRNWM